METFNEFFFYMIYTVINLTDLQVIYNWLQQVGILSPLVSKLRALFVIL